MSYPFQALEAPYTWEYVPMSLEQFYAKSRRIDCNPVSQRPDVSPNPFGMTEASKQQSIIDSIFRRQDIGEIRICIEENSAYDYESIDGGNRKRTILGFINNEYPTHASSVIGSKLFRDLTEEELKWFFSYPMRFVIYSQLTNAQKGEIFRQVNNITEVNKQETLNSYGDLPIANLIRETCRIVPTVANDVHPLFSYHFTAKGNQVWKNIDFNNWRLAAEETVARITYMIYKGEKPVVAPYKAIVSMYEDVSLDTKEVKKISKKLKNCLDFIYRCSQFYQEKLQKGLTKGRYTMLYRLYFDLIDRYGEFKVLDYVSFVNEFDRAMDCFNPRNKATLLTHDVFENGEPRKIHEAFNQHLGEHNTQYKFDNMIKWFYEDAGFNEDEASIISIDKRASFAREDIELKLRLQGYKCWVDGQPLTMKEAQGGHFTARSQGGSTEWDNLIVIRDVHNRRMQDTNAEEYKQMYLQSIKETA